MRKSLFNAAAWLSYQAIRALTVTTHWSLAIQLWLSAWLQKGIAWLGVIGMRLADSKRYDYAAKQAENAEKETIASAELKLMSTAVKLRDHSINLGDWTDEHTMALNAVGEALLNEAGWDDKEVHAYLRKVVESIEGLEYGLTDED